MTVTVDSTDVERLKTALAALVASWRAEAERWENDDTPGSGAMCLQGCARELEVLTMRTLCEVEGKHHA